MRALIVGYGYMGQIRRGVVDALDGLELFGICDNHLESIDSLGCDHFRDYEKALDESEPEVVFVCTPNRYSPDVCVAAMERGCHVFCEKPPGRNLADIRRIIDAESRHKGLKVMFGFNHRHHPAIVEAKSIVDAGRMGKLLWLRGVYGKSGDDAGDFENSWRNDPSESGGGILLDQGIHMLDLFRLFCGDFTDVQGMLSRCYWDIPVEDNAFVLLRNDRGQSAQLHSSATLWKHTFRLDMGLEGGYLIAQGLLSKSGSYGQETLTVGRRASGGREIAVGNPREETVYFDTDLSWHSQVEELVRCIEDDLPVTDSSSRDALRVMEIIDQVYAQDRARHLPGLSVARGGVT